MTKLRLSILYPLAVVLAGCAGETPPPPVDVAPPDAKPSAIAAAVSRVNIFDERVNIADPERSLHMPQTGIVGKEYDLTPALSGADRDLIEREVRGHFVDGERVVEVDVYIMMGKQGFAVGEMKEALRLDFAIRIEVADQTDVDDVITAEGSASLSRQAVHLDRDSVPGLYAQTIHEGVKNAFQKIYSQH